MNARGFKSFADKVTLDFEPGISVIVGPNGSGKSNVADAVLWVLGEQSPRNLRGTKMEDVIFAGSTSRQPFNMAEVSLSFDNRGGDMAVEFPEVVVTRRIYRSGESDYMLNKAPCRLVDIQELLSDLGVGRELTAVIGQNKLDAILGSQPEDRRAFLEEAAGLRKHRRRKEKALRKLEGMERNLLRVRDIISEVNKQLRPLEKQALQASEHGDLTSHIRELSIRIIVAEMRGLKEQWENRREEEERLARELEETSLAVKEGKKNVAGLEARLRELRQVLDGFRDREMLLLSLGERLRACEALGEERLKLYAALSGEIAYRDGWKPRREELARRRGELEEERKQVQSELDGLAREEQRLRGERKESSEELSRARREKDGLRQSLRELRERERAREEDAEKAAGEAEACRDEEAGLRSRREELQERLNSLREEKAAKAKRTEEQEAKRNEVSGKISVTREDLARFREELESISRKQRRSYQDEALVVARLRALQELFDSRMDYASAAARVLEEGGEAPGILGMLLHHIAIDEKWERALESFLGPWLFSVVTRDLDVALEAIRGLKREEEGYGIFLPLAEISRQKVEELKGLAHAAGGVHAMDVVDCSSDIRPALEYLLGDVVFCSSLEEAGEKAGLYPKLTFVTVEGDVIAPRRAVKGGSRPRSPFHIIAKRREVEELQEMLELCDEESVSLEVQRKSTLATINGLEKELEELAEEGRRIERDLREIEVSSRELLVQGERAESESAQLDSLIEALESRRKGLQARIEAAEVEAAEGAAEMAALEPRLAAEEEKVERLRERDGELEEKLHQVLARSASAAERDNHLQERIDELAEEVDGPYLPGHEEVAGMSRAQQEVLALVRRLMEAHAGLSLRMSRVEEKSREEMGCKEDELDRLRETIAGMEAREEELRELVHNRDLAVAQLKMRVDMLVQRLLEEHRLPVETALAEYQPTATEDEMRDKLAKLERRRDMLGQVNPRAVEEHKAMKERHDFLMEQVEDLRESKASLLKVVRAIDREIVRIFKETFEEVNQHFQELFEMLFPQGRAELSLSDPTDLLTTGVEIEAQPRGKRLKKLSLLSGGETALTSLAFLFAIFKTRPSPFYFLDEVEAALDDVNLHRFLNMLKEFKKDSQLVVITHQKRTMEIADVLYGVSMQATGVSRIVSQKLEEAERLARTGTA